MCLVHVDACFSGTISRLPTLCNVYPEDFWGLVYSTEWAWRRGLVTGQVSPANFSDFNCGVERQSCWCSNIRNHNCLLLPSRLSLSSDETCSSYNRVTMAKNKGSGAKKEDKTSGNSKGKGKGKSGGKDEKDTDSGTKKGHNEIYVRHILW